MPVIAALGMHAAAAGAGVGMVTMSNALEMATGEGTLPVAVQAMLCALEAALMVAFGMQAAAVGVGMGVLATCDVHV